MTLVAYRLALCLLALRVPRGKRVDWLAEWTSELWYVSKEATTSSFFERQQQVLAFCRGALEDSRCVRDEGTAPLVKASGSAMACCVWLGLSAGLCLAVASLVPGVQRALWPIDPGAGDIFVIAPSGGTGSVSLEAVRSLQHRPQRLFSELSFYQPITRPLHVAPNRAPVLSVAWGSANLLAVLGTPVWFPAGAQGDSEEPLLMLSEATWHAQFGASREVFGSVMRLGLQRVRLAGVVPTDAVPAGQRFDAWLLMPLAMSAAQNDGSAVVLLGRLAHGASVPADHRRWQMTVPNPTGATDYDCVALYGERLAPLTIFLFTLFLALLSLPATTSLSLGDYADRTASFGWNRAAMRRWTFLAVKVGFTLPAVYFGSLDLIYGVAWKSTTTPEYLQLVLGFAAILFALRWALRDQRVRCPVCLGKLSCPARVGQPSRNFLAWNGTELICVAGHGLMHVPELPTSWCGTQRWLYLDASWSNLFFDPA